MLVVWPPIVVLQKLKDLVHVLTNLGVCSEESKVGVRPSRLFVEVPGANMAVSDQIAIFHAINQE